MSDLRHALLERLSDELHRLAPDRPLRLAVDGRTASGKTTFADALGEALSRHRSVLRASIDGFHRPRSVRHARGRDSALGYYEDARDYAMCRALLLDPLGPAGDGGIRLAAFNLATDRPIDAPAIDTSPTCALIVDGSFLQRAEFDGAFDATVTLRVPADVACRRAVARDRAAHGGADAADALYRRRYQAAWELYEAERTPEAGATFVVDNADPAAPHLVVRS